MEYSLLRQLVDKFVSELQAASTGMESSLSFVRNTIPSSSLVGEGERFQVMAIGGTNFRSAIVQKHKGELLITEIVTDILPQLGTKEILFTFINNYLHHDISVLAINFGFGIKPIFESGKIDGIVFSNSKQHTLTGLMNKAVGKEFEDYVFASLQKKIRVTVANDAICLLLSGLTRFGYQELAGGIVGTGINFAIFGNKDTLINLEAGNFNKLPLSPETLQIDKDSTNPGDQLYEKEVAGGYLSKRFNLLAREANITYPPLKDGAQLCILAQERKDMMGDIARNMLYKSAELAAIAMVGIMEFQKKDITFVMQGSVFWQGYQYRETVETTVKLLTKYKITFVSIDNADILGAAKLVA